METSLLPPPTPASAASLKADRETRRSYRFFAVVFCTLIVLMGGAVVYGYTHLPDFATQYAQTQLGLPTATVGSATVDAGSLTLRDIKLDKEGLSKIAQIRITQQDFAADTIAISGAELSASIIHNAETGIYTLAIAGWPKVYKLNGNDMAAPADASPFYLPVREIALTDSRLHLVLPDSLSTADMTAEVAGTVSRQPEGVRIVQTLTGSEAPLSGTVAIDAVYDTSTGIHGTVEASGLNIKTALAQITGGTLNIKAVQNKASGVTTLDSSFAARSFQQGSSVFEALNGTLAGTTADLTILAKAVLPANPDSRIPAINMATETTLKNASAITSNIQLDAAGKAIGSIRLGYDLAKTGSARLDVTNLNLGMLPSLTGWEGLAATGTLKGTLPMVRTATGWRVVGGHLAGAENGTLTYNPPQYPAFLAQDDQRMATVRTILKQLQITSLQIDAGGDLMQEMKLALQIQGRNPDVSERPVHLNLNIEGAVFPFLKSILQPLSLIPSTPTHLPQQKGSS